MSTAMAMSSWMCDPPRSRRRGRPGLSGLGAAPLAVGASTLSVVKSTQTPAPAPLTPQQQANRAANRAARANANPVPVVNASTVKSDLGNPLKAGIVGPNGKSVSILSVSGKPTNIKKVIPLSPGSLTLPAVGGKSVSVATIAGRPTAIKEIGPTSNHDVLKIMRDPTSIFGGGGSQRDPHDHPKYAPDPKPFWWNERMYLHWYPQVAANVAGNFDDKGNDWFPSGWDHYDNVPHPQRETDWKLPWLPFGQPPPARITASNYFAYLQQHWADTANPTTPKPAVVAPPTVQPAAPQMINVQAQPTAAAGPVQQVTATRVQPATQALQQQAKPAATSGGLLGAAAALAALLFL